MSIDEETGLREIAFEVCTALDQVGTRAVLTGGGAATIWAPQSIRSGDLDFILHWSSETGDAESILAGLGFARAAKGAEYRHSKSHFFLEFPPGPLAIGDELLHDWHTLKEGEKHLYLLTPTDSCRDRLAAFFHWGDHSSLQQALAVAQAQRPYIDLKKIKSWSRSEGHLSRFQEFVRSLERR